MKKILMLMLMFGVVSSCSDSAVPVYLTIKGSDCNVAFSTNIKIKCTTITDTIICRKLSVPRGEYKIKVTVKDTAFYGVLSVVGEIYTVLDINQLTLDNNRLSYTE